MGREERPARQRALIEEQTPAGIRMFAVLVLHGCEPDASETWLRLVEQAGGLEQGDAFRLLICENEADEDVSGEREQGRAATLPSWAEYQSTRENGGLAWAYNLGLARAKEMGAEWLLTLDQDARLPRDFIKQMLAQATMARGRASIAAVVPQLVSSEGRVYSPLIAKPGRERAVPAGFTGVADGDVRAFNSGALMRVRWLDAIDGYPRMFWLDYLDHAVFRALGRLGGEVWIAGEVQVEHHLSLEDGRAAMSEARFRNFIEAEAGAMDLYGSVPEGWLYTLRLVARLRNQRRRGDPEHFSHSTRAVLRSRLRFSKKTRLRMWMAGLKRV